jgi:hypothetical protein
MEKQLERQFDLAWKLMVELRKELVASQKIRVQVMGFKIAFVSTGLGLIVAYIGKVPIYVLAIPAITAMFFDYSINSYSFSIKRIGYYIRKEIEPKLRKHTGWPDDSLLWEQFMCENRAKQHYSIIGNLGLTALAVVAAFYVALFPFNSTPATYVNIFTSIALLTFIVVFFVIDIKTHLRVREAFQDDKCSKKSRHRKKL